MYIGFTLKMETVSKNTIFGLKMKVKSGLEKIFLKFLYVHYVHYEMSYVIHVQYYIFEFLHKITNSVTKITFFAHEAISKKLWCMYESWI